MHEYIVQMTYVTLATRTCPCNSSKHEYDVYVWRYPPAKIIRIQEHQGILKTQLFSYQTVNLTNWPAVPTKYPCQIKIKSETFQTLPPIAKILGFGFYLAWIHSGDRRQVAQFNTLIWKKVAFSECPKEPCKAFSKAVKITTESLQMISM